MPRASLSCCNPADVQPAPRISAAASTAAEVAATCPPQLLRLEGQHSQAFWQCHDSGLDPPSLSCLHLPMVKLAASSSDSSEKSGKKPCFSVGLMFVCQASLQLIKNLAGGGEALPGDWGSERCGDVTRPKQSNVFQRKHGIQPIWPCPALPRATFSLIPMRCTCT